MTGGCSSRSSQVSALSPPSQLSGVRIPRPTAGLRSPRAAAGVLPQPPAPPQRLKLDKTKGKKPTRRAPSTSSQEKAVTLHPPPSPKP